MSLQIQRKPLTETGCSFTKPSILRAFRRGLDCLQLLPAGVELCEIFPRIGEVGGEPVRLRGVRAMKIRCGKQAFDAGDFRVHGVDLRFHASSSRASLNESLRGLAGLTVTVRAGLTGFFSSTLGAGTACFFSR